MPQIEDGYTRIATELLDALISYRIAGEQMQCFLFILRKTYGFNKTEDNIALTQFMKATGMKKPAICRALSKLEDKNIIIIKKDNKISLNYRINKYYKQWKPLSKKITLSKKIIPIIKKDNLPLSKKGTTIDNTTIDNTTIDKRNKRPLVRDNPPTEHVVYLYMLGYATEKKLKLKPDEIKQITSIWYNHYSSEDNNWTYMAGGTKRTKMKDWKAKARDWVLRENK